MYHFAWVDQREKQEYQSDVSLKRGIQISCTLGNNNSLLTRYFFVFNDEYNSRSKGLNSLLYCIEAVEIVTGEKSLCSK